MSMSHTSRVLEYLLNLYIIQVSMFSTKLPVEGRVLTSRVTLGYHSDMEVLERAPL